MTNTGDFRRYSYATDASYAVEAFNMHRSNQATAPAKPKPRERFTVHENAVVKSKSQLKTEQKSAFRQMIQIMTVAVISLLVVGVVISSFAMKNELTKKLAAVERDISNAQSDCVSLQSQLDSLVSMSMIEQYAVEQLGMTKVKSNQVLYIDVQQYKADRQATLDAQSQQAQTQQTQQAQAGNK